MKEKSGSCGFLNLVSFVALVVFAILEIFTVFDGFNLFGDDSTIILILNTIKVACVCIVIGFYAYPFVKDKKKGWKITFWVCFAILITSVVLGWLPTIIDGIKDKKNNK